MSVASHFTRLWAVAGLAALLTGCSTWRRASPVSPRTIQFNPSDAGQLPPDFSTALTGGGGPISWVVSADPGAPNGAALVQESDDDTSYRYPLCIYDKFRARDVVVEVKYKAISGKTDQAGGIVLRYHPENYYIARANSLEDNVDLFKTVNGKRLLIAEVPCKVSARTWHTLRFEAKGRHLIVAFDGNVIVQADDATFSTSGNVGLWTKADSVTAFADLKIEPAN